MVEESDHRMHFSNTQKIKTFHRDGYWLKQASQLSVRPYAVQCVCSLKQPCQHYKEPESFRPIVLPQKENNRMNNTFYTFLQFSTTNSSPVGNTLLFEDKVSLNSPAWPGTCYICGPGRP